MNVLDTMTQLLGVGQSECSLVMFATYSSAPLLLTLAFGAPSSCGWCYKLQF